MAPFLSVGGKAAEPEGKPWAHISLRSHERLSWVKLGERRLGGEKVSLPENRFTLRPLPLFVFPFLRTVSTPFARWSGQISTRSRAPAISPLRLRHGPDRGSLGLTARSAPSSSFDLACPLCGMWAWLTPAGAMMVSGGHDAWGNEDAASSSACMGKCGPLSIGDKFYLVHPSRRRDVPFDGSSHRTDPSRAVGMYASSPENSRLRKSHRCL